MGKGIGGGMGRVKGEGGVVFLRIVDKNSN